MKNTKIWLAVTGVLLVIIGIAIIAMGAAHLFGYNGVKKFDNFMKNM